MADERFVIPDLRADAGRHILDLTDGYGFDAHAAAWIHDIPTGSWRYLLATPMLKSKGPAWIYSRLAKLFRTHPLPDGISPLDIFVIDSEYELALFGTGVYTHIHPKADPLMVAGIHLMVAKNLSFEGFQVSDGFASFYRRLPPAERRRHQNPARSFDRRVSKLAA